MTSKPKKQDDGDAVLADINSPAPAIGEADKAKDNEDDSVLSELNENQK